MDWLMELDQRRVGNADGLRQLTVEVERLSEQLSNRTAQLSRSELELLRIRFAVLLQRLETLEHAVSAHIVQLGGQRLDEQC